jgi:uncharacterized SAM-binding protein YcdF (DUF218 family)
MINQITIQRLLRAGWRSCLSIGLALFVLVVIVALLIIVQGQREELRPAAAALVLNDPESDETPSAALRLRLDRAIDLYKRGLISRIILTGGVATPNSESTALIGQRYLTQRGLPSENILLEERGTTTFDEMRAATGLARSQGMSSVLLISDWHELLPGLKMANDLGLEAYAVPVRDATESVLDQISGVWRSTWVYINYVFLRT